MSARNRWCSCDQARGSLPCLALRHSAVVTFLWRRLSVLHLPASLRSTDITPLQRYYERSDSCSGGLGRPLANRPVLTRCRSPCFTCGTFRPFRLQPPLVAPEDLVCFYLRGLPPVASYDGRSLAGQASVGLRPSRAGSPRQQAESSSSSYGPVIHLRLLPTPSHDDAVTIGYKVQTEP